MVNSRPDIRAPRLRVAPSLLAADFGRLREQIAVVEDAGAEMLHLDVMDGHFVPNLSFGVPIIERIREFSDLYFDTHVMITDPDKYAEPFVKAGSNNYTFHIETAVDPVRLVDRVHTLGCDVGIALSPSTPGQAIERVLSEVDMVLIMSVWPGFGGQSFIPEVLSKAANLRQKLGKHQRLEFDGGIGPGTVADAAKTGADTFVAGSAIFCQPDPAAAYRTILAEAVGAVNGVI
jgi:ribulose-phosphate 3-epimerase